MKEVKLRMKEMEKYNAIKDFVDHGGNKNRIALNLGITKHQVNVLIRKYKEKGKSGFMHGNRSKKPAKTLDKHFSEDIILLYRTKYQGFNFKHFYEYLIEEENIKVLYSFVYTTLMKKGISSPRLRKSTKKRLAKEKLIKEKKMLFADQDAIFWSTTKKKLLPRIYNEQSRFNKKDTIICHFAKRLMFWPYPHTENFKQWNLPEVHTVLKCHAFDKDLEEYVKLKKQYEENRNEEVIYG